MRADLVNAELLAAPPEQVIEAANQALEILLPIENWPGVARLTLLGQRRMSCLATKWLPRLIIRPNLDIKN
jgi:hypothetical protein